MKKKDDDEEDEEEECLQMNRTNGNVVALFASGCLHLITNR
jgi:hypothetical protein